MYINDICRVTNLLKFVIFLQMIRLEVVTEEINRLIINWFHLKNDR